MALNITKCPHCYSANKSIISNSFYHCNKCGSNYYGDTDHSDGLIVSSGKTSFVGKAGNSKKSSYFIAAVIILGGAFHIAKPYLDSEPEINEEEFTQLLEVKDIMGQVIEEKFNDSNATTPSSPSALDLKKQEITDKAVPHTAYIWHEDKSEKKLYLFKATYLATNANNNENAVLIQKDGHDFVGYDAATQKIIPNFKQLLVKPLSTKAMTVYSDKNYIIIKTKVNKGEQLEMIDPLTGKINWTLSDKELPGLDVLNGPYDAQQNRGIELFRKNFRIKLQNNYYVVDKNGQVLGYGKL